MAFLAKPFRKQTFYTGRACAHSKLGDGQYLHGSVNSGVQGFCEVILPSWALSVSVVCLSCKNEQTSSEIGRVPALVTRTTPLELERVLT